MNNSNQYQEAILLNNDGIVIASSKKLTVDTTNFLLDTTKTSAGSTDAILRLGASSNPYLKYTIKNGLEITGKITATELTIGDKSASQFVKDNQNSDFVTPTDLSDELKSYLTKTSAESTYPSYATFNTT